VFAKQSESESLSSAGAKLFGGYFTGTLTSGLTIGSSICFAGIYSTTGLGWAGCCISTDGTIG